MKPPLALLLAATALAVPTPHDPASPGGLAFPNRVVLIRHAEKGCATLPQDRTCGEWPDGRPPYDEDGRPRRFPKGLNERGKVRAAYLPTLFTDPSSPTFNFTFGHILAAPWDEAYKSGERTYATVSPLAADLGLEIDISCANEPAQCVADAIHAFAARSDKDILVCWKHRRLWQIAAALGVQSGTYPDGRYDLVWVLQGGVVEKYSMHVPGLDDGREDEGDPDLEVAVEGSVLGWAARVVAGLFR